MNLKHLCGGLLATLLCALSTFPALSAAGQQAPATAQAPGTAARTVWDGVYAEAQAEAGQRVYEVSCGGCHDRERPLVGEAFIRNWGGDTLGGLFDRIRTTMPRDAPSSLSTDDYLNIIAYLLKATALPVGNQPLTVADVRQIQIVGEGGADDPPNFALVRVVACLDQRSDNSWVLINSSKPMMTRDPSVSKDADLTSAQAQPLGEQSYRLVAAYPSPEPGMKGHKFEAKGFLMKSPGNDGISITSLQSLSSTCNASGTINDR